MPDISSDKATATAYPPEEVYESWGDHADELDLSRSQFIIKMVEAGRRNIDVNDAAANSLDRLQRQRSELGRELDRQRERADRLERQLRRTAVTEIKSFVEENPGSSTAKIIQHVANTVPERVVSHLDLLEGDVVRREDEGYYLVEPGSRQNQGSKSGQEELET